jgi:hypothetical protein
MPNGRTRLSSSSSYSGAGLRTTIPRSRSSLNISSCAFSLYLLVIWSNWKLQEFLSAGFCFVIYTTCLLRIRGNLRRCNGRWALRFVHKADRWRLAVLRDDIDESMLRAVTHLIWYPVRGIIANGFMNHYSRCFAKVAYTVILVPISLARLSEFTGHTVPLWGVIGADIIFNLTGGSHRLE